MMIRLILIYTIFLLLTIQSLDGQAYRYCNCTDNRDAEPRLPAELSALPADTVTWYSKDWLSGDLFLYNGEVIRNKKIKYSGLIDELFWLEPKSGKPLKIDKQSINKFHFLNVRGDTSVYFRKIRVKRDLMSDSSDVFGQEIYSGKLSLFILHTFYIEQREIVTTNNGFFQKDHYKENPLYFIRFLNKRTVGLRSLNRKNLYTLAPDKKDQIKQFFKQTGQVRITTYTETKKLMQFLSTLIDQQTSR